MTQADRDRLVTLKKAKRKLITQKEAAAELEITGRHLRRLLWALKRRGDAAVIHALRGEPSNRIFGALCRSKFSFQLRPAPALGAAALAALVLDCAALARTEHSDIVK